MKTKTNGLTINQVSKLRKKLLKSSFEVIDKEFPNGISNADAEGVFIAYWSVGNDIQARAWDLVEELDEYEIDQLRDEANQWND